MLETMRVLSRPLPVRSPPTQKRECRYHRKKLARKTKSVHFSAGVVHFYCFIVKNSPVGRNRISRVAPQALSVWCIVRPKTTFAADLFSASSPRPGSRSHSCLRPLTRRSWHAPRHALQHTKRVLGTKSNAVCTSTSNAQTETAVVLCTPVVLKPRRLLGAVEIMRAEAGDDPT